MSTGWDVVFEPGLGTLDSEVWSLIIEIEAYKRSVLKIPLPPRMCERINQINIVRQIKGTTGIEGNTLTEQDITRIVTEPLGKVVTGRQMTLEEREVLNANRVLEYIRKYSQENRGGFLDEEMIRHIHFLTTDGCDYPGNVPGAYRTHQVYVEEYIPPEPGRIPDLMAQFIEFINSREVMDKYGPLIRAILAHFYLISIHPFGDGNGRTSRGIEAYVLYNGGYNVRGFYSLANYYYKNRHRYVEELQNARFLHRGKLTEFVRFSLSGLVQEIQQVQEEILRFVTKVMFKDYVNELKAKNLISWRVGAILEYMLTEDQTIDLRDFKSREHYLVQTVYRRYKGMKTLSRDLKQMLDLELVSVENGHLEPNMGVMQQFMDYPTAQLGPQKV